MMTHRCLRGASKSRRVMPGFLRGGGLWRRGWCRGWRQEAPREVFTAFSTTGLTGVDRRFGFSRSFLLLTVSVVFMLIMAMSVGCSSPGQERSSAGPSGNAQESADNEESSAAVKPQEDGPRADWEGPSIEVEPWQGGPRTEAIRHLLSAGVAIQKERPDWALDHYIEAMELTQDHRVVERAVQLAILLQDNQRIKQAAGRWQQIAPESAEANQLLGLVALREGEEDRAVANFKRFIEGWQGAPGDAFAQLRRALPYGADKVRVVRVLRRLVDAYPHTEQAHMALAQVAERAGRMDLAMAAAKRAFELALGEQGSGRGGSELLARSAMNNARLLRQAGNTEAALSVYNRALAKGGEDVDLLYGRGVMRAAAGDDNGAEEDLRRVLELSPQDPHAMNALGYTLADNGRNLDEALRLVSQALEQRPNSAAILDSKGWVMYRMGRLDEALGYLRKAWGTEKDAEIGAHLGELLWELDERDEARRIWQEAAQLETANKVLEQTLERYGLTVEEL